MRGGRRIRSAAAGLLASLKPRQRSAGEHARQAARLRVLVEYGSDLVTELDAAGRIRYASPSCEAVLGYRPDELIGTSALDLLQFSNPRLARALFAERVGLGGPQPAREVRAQHRDGSWRVLEAIAHYVAGADGQAGYVVVTARDVTQRKAAEDALRARERTYRELMEQAADGIFLADQLGHLVEVNEQACELLGYGRDELVGRRVAEVLTREALADVPARMAALRAGQTLRSERELLRRDGTRVPVEVSSRLLSDGRIQGIARDITGRRTSDAALRRSEERVRLATEAADLGIWDQDLTTGRGVWSAITRKHLGLSTDAPPSVEQFLACVHPDDREATVQAFAQARETSTYRCEFRAVWPDGSVHHLSSLARVRTDSAGQPRRMLGMVRDVTERKQAEAALRKLEEQNRLLIENANDVVIACDMRGRFTFVNRRWEALTGYAVDEASSMSLADVLHPEDRDVVLEKLRRRLAGAALDANYPMRIVRRDGQVRWVDANVSLLRRGDEVLGLQAFVRDITDRVEAETALAYQAQHDALTSLPNRSLLRERLDAALATLRQAGTPLALLLLDLDRFKEVNDTLGHGAGDAVLQQVAERLRASLRTVDTIARLGGDEFAVLVPGAEAATGLGVASRLRAALVRPIEVDGLRLDIGTSIGLALGPDHGQDAATLLRHADIAMYAAKRSGQGVTLYRPELDRDAADRLALTTELRQAIEQDQLVLHYQPKIELAGGQAAGVEALVRWQHPTRGLLGPEQFIPLAEQAGLIEPLTRWVLRAARAQQAAWRAQGLDLSVAVNLSMRSLHDPHLLETVQAVLAEDAHGQPGDLELELTESTLMADPERARTLLTDLRALGVRIAIDDFGTGYSSLAYLKRLPLDELKIDRCFVHELATDDRDQALVQATIELAHTLGLRVVAEGVEDAVSLELLGRLGCDLAQGDHVSRPVPAEEVRRWARSWVPPAGRRTRARPRRRATATTRLAA